MKLLKFYDLTTEQLLDWKADLEARIATANADDRQLLNEITEKLGE